MQIGNINHIGFELAEHIPLKELLNLNFYLGNKLISNEPVYISTYIDSLQNLRDNIIQKQFKNIKFEKFTATEIFNTLFNEKSQNESQFFNHLLQLDETINQYTIFIVQTDTLIQFIWSCWDKHNCNIDHKPTIIYNVQFPIKECISVINNFIKEINT